MPELPEVETVMHGLATRLQGRAIVSAKVNRADLRWPMPPRLAHTLTGVRVTGFRRRAKYILMRLDSGQSLLLHLGMSGRMVIGQKDSNAAHQHLVLITDDGWHIALIDPRRFGCVDLLPTAAEDEHRLLRGLGAEPLANDFTTSRLFAALNGRRTPIKSALLDQRIVAGLGNIYVCEALFRARLDPRRLAMTLHETHIAELVAAIRAVLTEAIAAGGSSLRDYTQPNGELGYFQHRWQVYGKEGAACPVCPGPPACSGVTRIAQSGRSTFLCMRLQCMGD